MSIDCSRLLNVLTSSDQQYDLDKVSRAFEYANEMHKGQFRKSGEEYISHPLAVAEIVASLKLDTDSICAALLHDTVEDRPDKATLDDISSQFGKSVAEIVDGLTKLVAIRFEDKEEEHLENLRKMFLAMSKDIRVIFIKLCDRLHNMRTLASHTDEKQRLIALETMHVYAPVAHRLGMQKIKQELEKLALLYLDPVGYDEVKTNIDIKYGQNRDFLDKAQELIAEKLDEQKIKYSLSGRVKSIYSMYKKMYSKNKDFDEIYDFYAVRILVDDELTCYTVLGIIHETFNSVPGRFKDYISTPKPNMYKSIHTTVIGRSGIPFEVQIRTWEMHEIAEYGLAAHWKYKSNVTAEESISKKLQWIHTLLETEKDSTDNSEDIISSLKIDLFEDEIFVFTPKGDVIDLPAGSTSIDFAYAIHTAVGNKMVGTKINGVIAPIDTVLQTGQIVDILTSSASKGPNRDWLKIVKTSEARNKIRQWYKKEKREENIENAKRDIDRIFRKFGIQYNDEQRDQIVLNVAKKSGVFEVEDYYNAIGYGGVALSKIETKLKNEFDKLIRPIEPEAPPTLAPNIDTDKRIKRKFASEQSVIIESVDNCQVKFAKCCNPLPGDSIIGFITKGFGISIHKYDCKNAIEGLKRPDTKDRWVAASWAKNAADATESCFDAILNVFARDKIGALAEISGALAEMHVGILSINSHAINSNSDVTIISITIRTKNTDHFNSIVSRLKKLDSVVDVTRGSIN
ncbi:MAG: bifunctional (p)ppGpp synthetase/guanosine-3',5'-bis(diphosphate) 3'-pyrophosphohydrolase [Ruminococcaceae bacterium]|nr:bifunctional (p)ppGpp synthetase/guanosine-3',5'-bis(diphosphate) 3'-pyrophosphohydrolase [Oscillospiraceae bacterium]